jgi:RNA-directed DNA polymerase
MATRTTPTRTTPAGLAPSADQDASVSLFQRLAAAYFDCRRHKRNSANALAFEQDLERNLLELHDELAAGAYRPGRSICFVVTHPKAREVWAASFRDRVVHHLLYNHIAPRFHAAFVADSCACIPGRGTLYAAQRLEHQVRGCTHNWQRPAFYLKADIANFFVSIHKPTLRGQLAARIDAQREAWWQWLTDTVLLHDPRTDVQVHSPAELMRLVPAHKSLFNAPAERGLPIGNLSSQFFANVYLNALDQHVKHQLRAPRYVRYVDDMVLVHRDPQWLRAALAGIDAFLPARLGVILNPRKTVLQPVDRGIDFVGQVLKPWRRTTRRRTLHRALARIETMPRADIAVTANSYFGLLRSASHSRQDRVSLANAIRKRGKAVAADLTKTF